MITKALTELADLAICASNDFHCLHLNVVGAEFDNTHKVLKDYYEQAADDYDSLAEFARMYDEPVPNANSAAERISYQAWEPVLVDRGGAIQRASIVLGEMCEKYSTLYGFTSSGKDPRFVGINNWVAGRLEYWAKELHFFNKSRGG